MATETVSEEFVTIVPVGESRLPIHDPAFVTVLTVGAAVGAAEVVVRRPRGARLGLGLKFEGGSAASEKVRRLLVQSCAENSPAASACTPWDKLIPGDEILAIDGVSVSELTRIDCVRRLKDSDETLTLLVRHFEVEGDTDQKNMDVTDLVAVTKQPSEIQRPTTLPPPVPPRKLGKKNSFKDKQTLQTVGEKNTILNTDGHKHKLNEKESLLNGQTTVLTANFTKLSRKSSFDSHILRQNKESIACLKKGSPEEVRRLVRRLSDGKAIPPEAEVYIDLLSTEWERCLAIGDAESDDTGSSISTVVDRLGSMTSSVENSIPSTPVLQPKTIDIQKVLNCIENIDTNILKDMTNRNEFLENQMLVKSEKIAEKQTFNGFTNHDNQTKITDEKILPKRHQNDKNNNNSFVSNGDITYLNNNVNEKLQACNKNESKPDLLLEKPKPMPRNVRVERSASEKTTKPFVVPNNTVPTTETLLTPTKKNCIETWLQHSEAEMSNKNIEKLEEENHPEILPRLIDFVPKTHFKDCTIETTTLTRPTGPPPPPPVETREDGSGASLDTIGELDESTDVTDNVKPLTDFHETNKRKTFERSFWEDRVSKSDAEDKSLSNDETPLPTCPRQPPDGVETPSEVVEKVPETTTRLSKDWPTRRVRYSYSSRTQDARSEASVKDKIAMFSNDHVICTDRLEKCGTLPSRTSTTNKTANLYIGNYAEVTSLDKRLTKSQDNLDDVPRSYRRQLDRPDVLGALENVGTMKNNRCNLSESKPLFYGSTATLPVSRDTSLAQPIYHARSVSDDNGDKKTHKSNLEYLIEQRKKSMSKLRGLVIPEAQAPIVDLPEIKVQDSLTKPFFAKSNQNNITTKEVKPNNTKPMYLIENKWKANILPNDIPKYSPAFKRKSLQLYTPSSLSKETTPERKFNEKMDTLSKINYNVPTPKHLINYLEPKSNNSSLNKITNYKLINKNYTDILSDDRNFKNVEIKLCTAVDVVDSDNDSAMSSTQSSYRSSASSPLHNLDSVESDGSRISPRISHYSTYSLNKTEIPKKSLGADKKDDYTKRNVCRSVSSDTNVSLSSSAGSAATSGSQASCSSLESSVADSDKRKVSKAYNIDTINRRNILASAKCRSGRDAKLNSPVIEAKFSHEPYDRVSSPTPKSSERLSTLTPSVSALTNKGENRRRNKIIAETDSDSDSEINVRSRKADYKNTRLKRNSSQKNKQNESNLDSPKLDEAPKCISERIIKEIKKAGLDNFTPSKTAPAQDKKSMDIIKVESAIIKKEERKPSENGVTNEKSNGALNTSVSSVPVEKPQTDEKSEKDSENNKVDRCIIKDPKIPTKTIRLKRGAGTGVGLILAGGVDCEAKDVTVHRVLADSVAAKAGLKRGAKVRSINGHITTGLTHAQSVAILKEQRTEVIIEIEIEIQKSVNIEGGGSENAESKVRNKIKGGNSTEVNSNNGNKGSIVTVLLEKAGGGAGLGFGLDGGRDSPQGDRPLTIKKLFAGGAAAQSGSILVGAELLSAGGLSMEGFTRTQAWAALKALPSGPVTLVLKNAK